MKRPKPIVLRYRCAAIQTKQLSAFEKFFYTHSERRARELCWELHREELGNRRLSVSLS